MRKTSIVILAFNNLAYNKLCVESIREFTPKGEYELIVVDNHSTDGTVEWLREQPDVKLVLNAENKGFPAGCNQGIRAAEAGNDILLLNNDTIVMPRWLENLRACLQSDPSVGAVGPMTDACSNLQQIPVAYQDFADLLGFAEGFNRSDPGKWEDRVRLIGFCLLIRREAMDRVGFLDERYGQGNYEDDDYSVRIRKAGYRLLLCGDCFIHHFGGGTFAKDGNTYRQRLEGNRRVFAEKWGFDPYLLAVDERRLLEPRLQELPGGGPVLVANCMFGAIPYYLSRRAPDARVDGLELNGIYAAIPVHGFRRAGSLEELPECRYRLVILLYHPWDQLSAEPDRMADLVEDGGTLLMMGDGSAELADMPAFCRGWRVQVRDGAVALQKPEKAAEDTESAKSMKVEKIDGDALSAMDFAIQNEPADPLTTAFLLRRIENDIDAEENRQRVFGLLKEKTIPIDRFKRIVLNETVNKADHLNTQGAFFYNEGNVSVALDLFIEAYKYETQDRDVVFNLAYALAEVGKREEAKGVLDLYHGTDEEIGELRRTLG